MIVDGLSDALRWDDLRDMVEELSDEPDQISQEHIFHDGSCNIEHHQQYEHQQYPGPASSDIEHHQQFEHHQQYPSPAAPSHSYIPLAAPPPPPPQHTPRFREEHTPRFREEYVRSELLRHAEHDWMERNGGRAHEWHSGNWYATPRRVPSMQRHISAPQESMKPPGIVWQMGNALEQVDRESGESPIASFNHRNNGRSSFQETGRSSFQETKSKSTGSFYVHSGESHNLFYGDSSAVSGAFEGPSATEEQYEIQDDFYGDGDSQQMEEPVNGPVNEPGPANEPVSEVIDAPDAVPIEPEGSVAVQPRVYRPNRLYTLSQRNQEHLRAQGTEAPPTTPKRPVVHIVNRIPTLKDRIDQQIKDFELEFNGLSSLQIQSEPEEQELSGQASADPNCVKDQLLLIGEEETLQPFIVEEPPLSLVCEEKMSSRDGAMSPSSREIFIPMLQAEALDDGDSYCESSNATSTSEHSPFSESSGQVVSMSGQGWNNDYDRTGEGDIMPSQVAEQPQTIVGDVGISVIVEVGSGAGFLRVSDVAPDSSAEASGDVRRGDIVISADGTDLTGSEAVLRGWKKTIQGPPGTTVSLCLMDPNEMRPRSMKLRRTPQDLTPTKMFAERQRQLVMSLQALGSDPRIHESLQTTIQKMRNPVSSRIPKVLVVGAKGHGRTALITSLLTIVGGGSPHQVALVETGLKHGQAPLCVDVGAVVGENPQEQQPMHMVASCAVDELETQKELEEALSALMTGRYLPHERLGDWRARIDSDEDASDGDQGSVHAVLMVHDCRIEPRPEVLRAVRAVSRDCGGVPVVVAVTKMEDVALYCTDMEGMVSKMAETLPKASFFPVAVVETQGKNADSTAWAVMELFERVRALGVHHAMYGRREASWQQSCDFVM